MTSIDDLRATLDLHADDLTETGMGTLARSAAVRDRVRAVRRRRRAVAASGTAAVLAAVAGVALLPSGGRQAAPEPATTVVGLTPPAQLSALGYDYDFTEGLDGDGGRVTLDLPESDLPRLISWGTSGADDRVTIDGPAVPEALTYDVADFSDFYYVGPGVSEKLTIRSAGGQPGIAVYTLGDGRPAGLTTGGVTFRQAPPGRELLGAAVGEPGESEVVVLAAATSRVIEVYVDCETAASSAYLHVDLGGKSAIEGDGCGEWLPVDAAAGGAFGFPTQPGEDATVRAYLTDGPRGPQISSSDVRLSVGVYARTDTERLGTIDDYVPPLVEHHGHLWRQVSRVAATAQGELTDVAPESVRPVLTRLFLDTEVARVRIFVDGRPATTQYGAGLSGGAAEIVRPGQTVALRVEGTVAPDDQLSIGFYEQVR